MADRAIIVAVESGSTGAVLGLRLSAAEDGQSVNVRQDATYDEGNPQDLIGLGANVVNRTSTQGSVVNLGATWSELSGDGQTFRWTTHEEIAVQVFAIPLGHHSRGTSVPAGSAQRPLTGLSAAMTLEIGEDGYFRPDSTQLNDFYASVRQLVRPEDAVFHYTTRAKVETRLLSPRNREAGWEADFGEIITDCILAAEAQLDEYLGRTFRPQNTERTDTIEIRSERIIATPDMRGDRSASVRVSGSTVPATSYRFKRPYPEYDVMRNLLPRNGWVPPIGQDLTLTFTPGWPVVPAPITEAATRAAAEIYRAGELSHGIVETGGIPIYARQPLKGIVASLRPFRAVAV